MQILLIEPNYKNKYPPMGLMKISTYHKNRGDNVRFYKGQMPEKELMTFKPDRIYITSLFTFYYDKVMETLKYYKKYISESNIYMGGIMVTILYDKVCSEVGNINLMTGLLEDSRVLGLDDCINIDQLPLDYSILDQIEYEYPADGNYFAYTTRGCPNKCRFCAVPILEPEFHVTNNIYEQVMQVNEKYGEKRNLLLLDNNIFNLDDIELQKLVNDMHAAGFTKTPTYVKESDFEIFLKKADNPFLHDRIVKSAVNYLKSIEGRIKCEKQKEEYRYILQLLEESKNQKHFLMTHKNWIRKYVDKYKSKRVLKRYVDFNQGLEAARMTPSKTRILSQLPLRPVRIAFDHYNPAAVKVYKRAVTTAAMYGMTEFSNYMLYNYDDKPEDLWYRIKINVDLAKDLQISMFSFPMKYMPITETDRNHVGPHWNKKYLQSMPAILLVTKGVVADGEDFFYRAFGKNVEEFHEILAMPKDFIIYRSYYEEKGYAQLWKKEYDKLSKEERNVLIDILSEDVLEYDQNVYGEILQYYEMEYRYTVLEPKKDADQ